MFNQAGVMSVGFLILGYVLKSGQDWLMHRQNLNREREARDELKREQRFERTVSFQRQTLLKLQDALMDLGRAIGKMSHQDAMSYRATGKWQKQLFGHELSEECRLAFAKTSKFSVRIRDEVVRELVKRFKANGTAVLISTSPEDSKSSEEKSLATFEEVNERIGQLLRDIDEVN